MWKDQPINSISLYAMVIPDEPAPTLFASGVGAAAESAGGASCDAVEGLSGLFLIDFTGGDKRYFEETASAEAPRATQKVLYDDPVSGKTSLVVDSLFFDKFVGWERDEQRGAASRAARVPLRSGQPLSPRMAGGRPRDLEQRGTSARTARSCPPPASGPTASVSGTYKTGTTAWDASFRD